jgi:hypothetical protein
MGKYLNIAKKFETHQGEAAVPRGKTPYCRAVEALREDCWAIDPLWLCDKHFPLWMEIRNLDDVLSRLEKEGVVEEYQSALARLVGAVKKALALYEGEQKQTGEVRQ